MGTKTGIQLASLIFSYGLVANAQVFDSVSWHINGDTATVNFGPPRVFGLAEVTGAPFVADRVSEHTQRLSDGTQIHKPAITEHISRDSQGRTRTERPAFQTMVTAQHAADFKVIVIVDTVAGFAYLLDDQNKVAHRVRVVLPARRPATRAANLQTASNGAIVSSGTGTSGGGSVEGTGPVQASDGTHPSPVNERLGSKNIEGLIADGTRSTTTWPVDSLSNDRQIVMTNEIWRSAELKEVVLSKRSSPFNGEDITKLINVNRTEPDASLFQPPMGYAIVDEKESFKITIKRQ